MSAEVCVRDGRRASWFSVARISNTDDRSAEKSKNWISSTQSGGVILPLTSEFRSKMILNEETQKIQVGIPNS